MLATVVVIINLRILAMITLTTVGAPRLGVSGGRAPPVRVRLIAPPPIRIRRVGIRRRGPRPIEGLSAGPGTGPIATPDAMGRAGAPGSSDGGGSPTPSPDGGGPASRLPSRDVGGGPTSGRGPGLKKIMSGDAAAIVGMGGPATRGPAVSADAGDGRNMGGPDDIKSNSGGAKNNGGNNGRRRARSPISANPMDFNTDRTD